MDIININGQLVTDSRDVAEMVGRTHDKVIRDIRNITEHLGDTKIGESYFIESTYMNSQNKELPCYLLSKKGCELYATRMTGEKGTRFAMKYIEQFNKMEQELNKPINSLELALQAALKHEQEIKGIKSDVDYLKGSMRIDSLQQQEIQQEAKKSIVHALGGKDSNAYIEISKKAFSAFWNEFKQYFKVPRYGDIPKVKQEEAIRFIRLWRPSTTLQMEIDSCNSQMTL
ncbi:Rha family transcriptional regulator [Psychrobacillus antarcticus]|uniref:Rha family transcriptional regulator n=1 Tax=Psychrobacillus antarcticus TaxID=2879115 RepID=UPI002407C502|nr:Rha family transcriptional regulator [Psychrobacillus antarcticus]